MPERFLGDWPKDAFILFCQCLCRRNYDLRPHCSCPNLPQETVRTSVTELTATCSNTSFRVGETEGIAVINMLVSRYKMRSERSLNLPASPLKSAMRVSRPSTKVQYRYNVGN